jgi:hypothetical protein
MNRKTVFQNLRKLLKQSNDVLVILKDGTVYKVPEANLSFVESSYKIGKGMGIFLDLAGKSGLERRIEALESEQNAIKDERDVLKITVKNLETKNEHEDDFVENVDKWYTKLANKFEANFKHFYKLSLEIQKIDKAIVIEPIVNVSSWSGKGSYSMIAATKTFPCYRYRESGRVMAGRPFKIGIELLLEKKILIGEAYLLGNNGLKSEDVGEADGEGLLCAPRFAGFVKSLDGTLAENIVTAIDYVRSVIHGAVSANDMHQQDFKRDVVNVGMKRAYQDD